MKPLGALLFILFVETAGSAAAQDLLITGARIIVGNGQAIEDGSVVVRAGRIASVGRGNADAAGMTPIDAGGWTLVPGYIDGHRHFPTGGDQIQERMREFLEAGYTTLLHGGGTLPGVIEFRRRVASGPRAIRALSVSPS